MRNRIIKIIYCIAFLSQLGFISGCANNSIASWQRGNLAKPVMIREMKPHQTAFDAHKFASKETTSGGFSVGGGGCGCN